MTKTALITGSAVRIGAQLALSLARQGWDVAIHCHNSKPQADELAKEIRQIGQRACVIVGDLADCAKVSNIIAQANAELGTINCLIHNASLFEKDNLTDLTPTSLRAHLSVNLESPILLTQAFVKQLPADIKGNIICLLDGMKGWSLSANYLSYSSSRLALWETMLLLVKDLSPQIRINAIALGATLIGKQDNEEIFERLQKLPPLQRNSNPQEVVDALHFLLNAEGMTGQVLDLSGGMGMR